MHADRYFICLLLNPMNVKEELTHHAMFGNKSLSLYVPFHHPFPCKRTAGFSLQSKPLGNKHLHVGCEGFLNCSYTFFAHICLPVRDCGTCRQNILY